MSLKNNMNPLQGLPPVLPHAGTAGAQLPMQSPQSLLLMSGAPGFSPGGNMFKNPMEMPWAGQFGQGQLNYGTKQGGMVKGIPTALNSNTSMSLDAGKGSFRRGAIGPSTGNPFLNFAYMGVS